MVGDRETRKLSSGKGSMGAGLWREQGRGGGMRAEVSNRQLRKRAPPALQAQCGGLRIYVVTCHLHAPGSVTVRTLQTGKELTKTLLELLHIRI